MNHPRKKNPAKKSQSAREIALDTIYQILEKEAFSNLKLEKNLLSSTLKSEDKKLVTEIVNGTIRMRLRLDWSLEHFLKKDMRKLNPWVRNILRMSAYQILFMERIPDHAVVSEAVRLTRHKASEGLTGLCNGVLRSLLRQKDCLETWLEEIPNAVKQDEIRYSIPNMMMRQLHQIIPPAQRIAVLEALNRPGSIELRCNQQEIRPKELLQVFAQEHIVAQALEDVPGAIEMVELHQPITALRSFQTGKFYIQNRASQLGAYIADPQPQELIIDLCCGVGGKSTHLAEKSQDQATIIAVERYAHKLQLLLENCARLNLHSIRPLCADITQGLPEYEEKADRVILDAPCSGWGVLNRRADIRWGQDEKQLEELQQLQGQLLEQAARLVRPGGMLLYITCTLRPEENEKRIFAFLQAHPEYRMEGFDQAISFFPLTSQDQQKAREGMLTLLPGIYGTDGMFYTKLRKDGSYGSPYPTH